MHLQRNQIPGISRQIVRALASANHIETDSEREVSLDVESVLTGYVNSEQDLSERARDMIQQRGLSHRDIGRVKQAIAEQRGLKTGEEALTYVLDQLVAMLFHSSHVEEVFAEDHELRLAMRDFLRATDDAQEQVEAEVRSKLKHVKEGSRMWEIEYQRMKEEIKRRRGAG